MAGIREGSMGKKRIIWGKLDQPDLDLLRKELSPRGLYLQVVIDNPGEAPRFRSFSQPWN
jgi:hypothetical protein